MFFDSHGHCVDIISPVLIVVALFIVALVVVALFVPDNVIVPSSIVRVLEDHLRLGSASFVASAATAVVSASLASSDGSSSSASNTFRFDAVLPGNFNTLATMLVGFASVSVAASPSDAPSVVLATLLAGLPPAYRTSALTIGNDSTWHHSTHSYPSETSPSYPYAVG